MYRPREQQNGSAPSRSEFTFTSNNPAPQFPPATTVERGAPRSNGRGRGDASGNNNARFGRRGGHAGPSHFRGGGRGRGGFRSQAAHERALLQSRDDSTEHFLGVAHEANKFRDLAELSDDEEADMDVGTDDTDDDGATQNKTKVTRTQSTSRDDGDSVPKWSNPDPYIVLPPPDETTGKRIDFVKLIRKAKNEVTGQADASNAVTANDDFISFGDEDEDEASEVIMAPTEAASRSQPLQGSLNEVATTGSANARGKRSAEFARLPTRLELRTSSRSAGLPPRPDLSTSSRKRKQPDDYGGMKPEWAPKDDLDSAPWAFRQDYERLRDQPERLLHNEIMDFYDFVGPKEHDNEVRLDLIRRVHSVVSRTFQSHPGYIKCFGSFPVGLYLPAADMDLVFVTDTHYRGGPAVLNVSKSQMYKLAEKLRNSRVAKDTFVIAKAKVPIVKFTDIQTGLPVDISFENMSGLDAQGTMSKWKKQHGEHFTYLVALVKQLLEMYNLNEVSSGGIGGLSICCLVVHYLQHHPAEENFGLLFLGFLDYYGNKFNYGQYRIVIDPPAIIRKGKIGIDGRQERADRLAIQDPNNPTNNLSGGSHSVDKVFKLFTWVHRVLEERMRTVHMSSVHDLSLLESILGGNYTKYHDQRATMDKIRIQ
ncbi:hypothetical protein BU23DRAFT_651147 [Bimuria novae-zelandiae CBS 107.79]|uniref:polynucleotide adenylyltransferase n=1 Tax=Bimuria novae-zelandiae CBS 107.79 TaxID=1447943 RepID=A0A6A5VZ35_9PLEO|nr:hypothetical protein BU23DRAFT_651147 [Bimuria novae-zelandiae CBS 107.79]